MNGRMITRARGQSMIELVIALAISALLLTATAVGVDASFKGYRINEEQSTLIHRARIAVERLTTVIRTTRDHAPDTATARASFAAGQTVTDSGIALFDNNNVQTIFRFDQPNSRVLAIVGGQTYVLADGVQKFQVKLEPMRSPESIRTGGGWDLLQRATITLTLIPDSTVGPRLGGQLVTLTASVVPRRNVW